MATQLEDQTPSSRDLPAAAPHAAVHQEISLPEGAEQLCLRLEAPDGARLRVDVEARTTGGQSLGEYALEFGPAGAALAPAVPAAHRPAEMVQRWLARLRDWPAALPLWLLWAGLAVYAFTRLYALPAFPIYFFTDEAVQTVTAADLLRDHMRSPTRELLPTYFQNGSQYNLSTSVYLQALPYFFFGKSIWVTRGTAALMTLLAALSVGLLLRQVFKVPDAWLAVMILSVTPAWFLHSRTAFETTLAVSFYAVFLYAYLRYRQGSPRLLYAAVLAGALAFYSYTAIRLVILVTALLLLISDVRYHWQQRRIVLRAFTLALLLALPFLRFLYLHPEATGWQMQLLGSYWILDVPLTEKLKNFALEYLRGLDPLYWYLPNDRDLVRHTMEGYGHLLRQTLPLGVLGLYLAMRRVRLPEYRALLIAVLAAPAGAALVRVGITRVLVMVIPMALLTALGAAALLDWLRRRFRMRGALLSLAAFVVLAGINLYMLRDSLVNGPLWYHDYGLTGMQYGAKELFGAVRLYLTQHPGAHMIISPSWANGTDVIARFFFNDPQPFDLGSVTTYFNQYLPLDPDWVFVMIPEEYEKIPASRFSKAEVVQTLPFPDGRTGFYFVKLSYVDNINDVIAKEEEQRRRPRQELLSLNGQDVLVSITPTDMGSLADLFDGKPATLVRTWAINPLQVDLAFQKPVSMKTATLRVGGTATTVTLRVWGAGQTEPIEQVQELPEVPLPRDAVFDLPEPMQVDHVWIEVRNTNDPEDGHVHLWDITFQ